MRALSRRGLACLLLKQFSAAKDRRCASYAFPRVVGRPRLCANRPRRPVACIIRRKPAGRERTIARRDEPMRAYKREFSESGWPQFLILNFTRLTFCHFCGFSSCKFTDLPPQHARPIRSDTRGTLIAAIAQSSISIAHCLFPRSPEPATPMPTIYNRWRVRAGVGNPQALPVQRGPQGAPLLGLQVGKISFGGSTMGAGLPTRALAASTATRVRKLAASAVATRDIPNFNCIVALRYLP